MLETKNHIDQIDLMLLYYLKKNSRISNAELGKKVKLTSAGVSYRIKRLLGLKVLRSFTISIDNTVLTPSYQAYLISMTINPSDLQFNYQILSVSHLFERIIQVASSENVIGITIPISNKDLKNLVNLLNNKSIKSYSITPIIDEITLDNYEIFGENVHELYCPECQDSFSGEGFIDQIGNQEFGFCCKECRDVFKEKYEKLQPN
ncbi:MAG: Lrp/AsnC family transcriptional regulator [Candidatus Kariarchaeaceae archaeon]|jgi:DNA-binding Lrp family transcriptional regulator